MICMDVQNGNIHTAYDSEENKFDEITHFNWL